MPDTDDFALDPFAGLADDPEPDPQAARDGLLASALRGYVPISKVFVQKPRTEKIRASTLAALVTGREHRALDFILLLYALFPILPGSPLPISTWARILSTRTRCTPNAASKTLAKLEDLRLVTRVDHGRTPVIEPLREDGSGRPWTRPGLGVEDGPGYFTLPHAYWTAGHCDDLTMPGKAMLLIMLAETQDPNGKLTFSMAVERAQGWYGISERTAERGYTELSRSNLLLVRKIKIKDDRHPAGRRDEFHRALDVPFSTAARMRLQKKAQEAATRRAGTAASADVTTAELVADVRDDASSKA